MSYLRTAVLAACVAAALTPLTACSGEDTSAPASSASSASASTSVSTTAARAVEHVDVQAHRGGRGETTEESRLAFEKALAQGVDTLELDIVLSKDGVPVIWHDPDIKEEKCRDTFAATPGDPHFPYVGKDVHDLTWPQLQTLRCDKTLADYPDAEVATDNQLLQLKDLFDLAEDTNPQIRYNIETKIEGAERDRSATPEEFVDAILAEVDDAGNAERVAIQSFDWRSLPIVAERNPQVSIVALYDETTWVPNSPWLGDTTVTSADDDPLPAIKALGADIASPKWQLIDADYVTRAHDHGLKVIPWTINEKEDMRALIADGVDGIITDYPTRLQEVIAE